MNQKLLTMVCLKNILVLQHLLFWQKKLYDTRNKDKNNVLENVIKCWLRYLNKEITNMSEEEKKIEKPDKILKIVREILDFNKKNSKPNRRWLQNINIRPNAQQITNHFSSIKSGT